MTLSWNVKSAVSAQIEPHIGPIQPSKLPTGSTTVTPTKTTTYTLTAIGVGTQTISKQVIVAVPSTEQSTEVKS